MQQGWGLVDSLQDTRLQILCPQNGAGWLAGGVGLGSACAMFLPASSAFWGRTGHFLQSKFRKRHLQSWPALLSGAHWSGKGRVGFPCFPGDIKSYLAPDPRASCWGCGCQLIEEVFPEGSPGPFRKTSLGLLIPQPLALPLRDDPGVRPLTLEGDQEPASSSSLAPQLLLSILRYLTPLGHFQALSPQVTSSRSPGP